MGHIFEKKQQVWCSGKHENLQPYIRGQSSILDLTLNKKKSTNCVSLSPLHKLETANLCCAIWKANDSMWIHICSLERRVMCKFSFHQSGKISVDWGGKSEKSEMIPVSGSLWKNDEVTFSFLFYTYEFHSQITVQIQITVTWAFLPYFYMTVFVNHLACSLHHVTDKMSFFVILPQSLEHRIQKKFIQKKSETLIELDYSI